MRARAAASLSAGLHRSPAARARQTCAALLLTALGAGQCFACYSPPAYQLISVDEQIAQAVDVSVATVVRARPDRLGMVQYDFVVIKRLRGPARDRFSIVSPAATADENPRHSDDHSDGAFWSRGGGRLANYMDCRIHPRFTVGESYLAFYGQPITRRSFERIAVVGGRPAEDKWLSHVEQRLGGPWRVDRQDEAPVAPKE